MRGITKISSGLALLAGIFCAGSAMAMGDGYVHGYYRSPAATYYYETQTFAPYSGYDAAPYASYGYAPYVGYYDNPYNPYWAYRGPLGQGSGSDMRIGR